MVILLCVRTCSEQLWCWNYTVRTCSEQLWWWYCSVRTCSEQLWWWYCTVWEHIANSCGGDTALSEHVANSCDGDTALSEHLAKVINRTLTAVMWSSVDSIQYAVCYLAVWMFTALLAWLFSRHNTVDASDCCGIFCDERGRQCCSLSCHIMSAQVCTEGSVSSLPVTLCYQYMFLWPPAVDGVTEQTANNK